VLENTNHEIRTCIFRRLKNRPTKIKITDQDAVRSMFEAMEKTVNNPKDSAVVEIGKVEETVKEQEDCGD
jgi:hypothetical protein